MAVEGRTLQFNGGRANGRYQPLNRLSQLAPGLSLVFADEHGNVGGVEIA
jgi:hypothetical protein